MPVLTTEINSSNWSISAVEYGEIVTDLEDLAQCILLILSTAKGSDPFRPNFGFDLAALVDKPVNFVIPNGKLGIIDAITEFEPRVTVTSIEHELDVSHVTFKIYCSTNFGEFSVSLPINPIFAPSANSPFSNGFGNGFGNGSGGSFSLGFSGGFDI